MIIRDLVMNCSIDNVAKEMKELSCTSDRDYEDLKRRLMLVIEEIKCDNQYAVLNDDNFCIVAKNRPDRRGTAYVTLCDTKGISDPYGTDEERFNNLTDFSWNWYQGIGLFVMPECIEKYGTDVIVAGFLYEIMYFDDTEEKIGAIRKKLEKEADFSKVSQKEFYGQLLHEAVSNH